MQPSRSLHVLALATFALAAVACEGQPSNTSGGRSGADLYATQGCTTCHGPDRKGGKLAPAISPVDPTWTREALVEYLTDPQAYAAKVPRLAANAKKYMMPMPKYGMLSAADRGSIADYVLGGGR